jgi:hypothetical protein
MPKQSTYLKFLFGVQDNTRLPGDVGLAQDKILIPFWQNITLAQGVQPIQYGGVPRGFLARLSREVAGTKAKARVPSVTCYVYRYTVCDILKVVRRRNPDWMEGRRAAAF